jgi:molybdopterin adenylyltransferase
VATLAGRRVCVLTLSETVFRDRQRDGSGDVIVEVLAPHGVEIVAREVLPDDRLAIADRLRAFADTLHADLVLTTGGSGVAPGDVTPEATLDVVDRVVPGLPEAARVETRAMAPMAMLSRGVAGIRGRTLIVNLPGHPKAVREWLGVLLPVLPHALALLADAPPPWGTPHHA